MKPNGTPMDSSFTHFISYSSIDVDEIDLYEDAYGLNAEFIDVKEFLSQIETEPGRSLSDQYNWKVPRLN